MTFDELCDRLSQRKLGGNYFLKAEDSFLRDEAIDLLTAAHLDGGPAEFDLDQISGDDVDSESLASRLETPPLVSPYRVVVVRDAQALSPSARKVVEAAVQRSVAGRVLILAAEIPRASKAKFYKLIQESCTVVALPTPRPSELPGWLVERARSVHNVKLEIAAAQLLVSGIGARLGILARELEKLVTYVAPRDEIRVEEVREAVGVLPQVDRWRWVDRVLNRELQSALAEVPALLDSGESAVGLVASLGEALIRVGLASTGEATLTNVLKRDGSYGHLRWKIPVYVRQARGWNKAEIEGALDELLRADRLIKSGGLSDRAALEEALLRISALEAGERSNGSAAHGRGGGD